MAKRKFDPHIIVANDKYGDRMFNANTPESACRALIKLFKERDEEGWYGVHTEAYVEIKKAIINFKTTSLPIDNVFSGTQCSNWDDLYWLLYSWFDMRSSYEYEGIDQQYFEEGYGQ